MVAIAEVAVYSAFNWRMADGEKKEGKTKEVKEVVQTWVVNPGDEEKDGGLTAPPAPDTSIELEHDANSNLRQRIKDSRN